MIESQFFDLMDKRLAIRAQIPSFLVHSECGSGVCKLHFTPARGNRSQNMHLTVLFVLSANDFI